MYRLLNWTMETEYSYIIRELVEARIGFYSDGITSKIETHSLAVF